MKSLLSKAITDKVLAVLGFVFVFLALLVISRTPPATGYELSIYSAYPAYFWFFITASSVCGMGILIRQAFAAQKSNWWLAGLLLVISSNSVFLGLPFFRGYAFFPTGDAMTHVGMMKDIIATGHIGAGDYYPVIHLLGVSLLNITGLSYATLTNLLFVFFSMVYLLNIYLLATVITNQRGQALLITAFASPLIFSFYQATIHPCILSIFMLPLLLYFYHRRQKIPSEQVATVLLMILLALLITFFHPATAIFAIAVVLTLNLSMSLYRRISGRKKIAPQSSRATVWDYIAPLTSLVVFLIAILPYPDILRYIRSAFNFLAHGTGVPLYKNLLEALAMSGITPAQTIELFIARYGAIFIYGIIAGIAVIMVLRMRASKKAQLEPMHFRYAILFIVALAASVFFLFSVLIERDPVRISQFFLMVAPLVSGLVLYKIITRQQPFDLGKLKPGKRAFIGSVVILIVVASVLSTFNVYNSPWVVDQNFQVTRMEITGAEWFSSHRDTAIAIASSGVDLYRFDDFNFGMKTSLFQRAPTVLEQIPSHFGYDKNSSITETFDFQDMYLLTSEKGRTWVMVVPENIRYKALQYTAEDFARLEQDPAVAQIYANGEFEVWRVYG